MKEIRAVKPDVLCGQVSGKENNLVHRSVINMLQLTNLHGEPRVVFLLILNVRLVCDGHELGVLNLWPSIEISFC